MFATCTCLLLIWGQTQTELVALKKKSKMAEKELRASKMMAQQLATKNEEMAVSYSTFITITHATCMVVCMYVTLSMSIELVLITIFRQQPVEGQQK